MLNREGSLARPLGGLDVFLTLTSLTRLRLSLALVKEDVLAIVGLGGRRGQKKMKVYSVKLCVDESTCSAL